MRILHVEDNPMDADLFRRELSRQNPMDNLHQVTTLAEARQRLSDPARYDILLSDLNLPDGNGMELLAEIRQKRLPLAVVILTSVGDEETAVSALKAGANDYLAKREGYVYRLPLTLEAALMRFRNEVAREPGGLRAIYAENDLTDTAFSSKLAQTHAPHISFEVVRSAAEVLRLLPADHSEKSNVDVLLLDYRLADGSGLDLLKTVRIERGLDMPVILVTKQGDEEIAAHAMRLGASDYLVKHSNYMRVLPAILENAHHRVRLAREQEALRASEERFRSTLDNMLEGCQIIDFDYRYLYVNKAAEAHNQYRKEELLGHTMMERFPGIANTTVFEAIAKCMKERTTQRWEGEFVFPNGSVGWFDVSIEPVPEGIFILSIDVTARKHAQQALGEAQALLQRAVTAGNIGMWEWDLNSDRMVHSSEWKRQLGYEDHEINGSFGELSGRLHPDDRDGALEALRGYAKNPRGIFRREYRLKHKDGTYRWILAQGSVPEADSTPPSRVVGTHVDISDLKLLEEQFMQAQKMESVGRLAGGVAHDFNNLLAVINGYADMVLGEIPKDSALREDITQIRQAGDRAAALTRQLLAFSRKQVLQPRVLNLTALVRDAQSMLRRVIGEDVQLNASLATELGNVKADPAQIEQVIMNLAVNARDAMPNGGRLTIQTRNAELDEEYTERPSPRTAPYVMLAVSDTGTGIDKETLAKIFDPFFTTKEQGKGTGLGLSTVYGIVKQSDGHVFVYSEVGKGTTFKIFLPRVDAAAQEEMAAAEAKPSTGNETLLVVEDEDTLRVLTQRILRNAGYMVLAAANGDEALKLFKANPGGIDLLLTDVVMPGLSGKALADRVQEIRPDIPVIYMSGYLEDTAAYHGVMEDAAHFIGKPFTANSMNAKVREVLDLKQPAKREK